MASTLKHHHELTDGVGKCSVPMWSMGMPAGFCDEPAYGERAPGKRDIGLSAHRVAFYLNRGRIDQNLLVCHTCDNRKCCNPNHLFQGTQKDNMQDFSVKHHSGNKSRYIIPERTGERSKGIKKWRKS